MAFTDEEKVRIRHHLGYMNVGEANTFILGVPAAVDTAFIVEPAMEKVLPAAEAKARSLVRVLDGIETQMTDDLELLAVNKIGNIEINQEEQEKLTKQYLKWRAALANLLGIIPNPYDQRFQGIGGGGINVPVQGP